MYTLALVRANYDLIIVVGPLCEDCFESKLKTSLFDQFKITGQEATRMQKQYGIRAVRIHCTDKWARCPPKQSC